MSDQACSVFDCDREDRGRGLCHKHWTRWRRHGDPHTVGTFGPESPGRRQCLVHHCHATPAPDGDGWCWEHAWRFAWPLPLPEHIPDEPEPGWHLHAACLDAAEPEDWWPSGAGSTPPAYVIEACAGCPVRGDCIAYAVAAVPSSHDEAGVWGSSPGQRRQVRQWRRQEAA